MDISVIVPTLNEEKSIEVCLKSIRSQKTNKEYEIIVSDCGSEDNTVEIARRYADKVVFSKKKSIAVARNTGAKYANGKYLVFIDADTVMPENYLEKVSEKFEKDPNLLGFSSGFRFSRNDGKIKLIEKFTNSYLSFRDRVGMVTMPGFSTSVRKEVFDSLNGFRDVPLEDGEFSIRLRKSGKTRYFSDFYVITSSRRLDEMGLLGTLRYYFEMDLARREPGLKKFLPYGSYMPLRIEEDALVREFSRIYDETVNLRMDSQLRRYMEKQSRDFIDILKKTEELKKLTRKQFFDRIAKTSKSIAELKLVPMITKKDVDRAIRIISRGIGDERKKNL